MMWRILAAGAAVLLYVSGASAAAIPITQKVEGSFLTNQAGVSATQPPYIQTLRSREGLEYTLNRIDKLKNRVTHQRVETLRKILSGVNYDTHMILAVFSQPMDNYIMSISSITMDREGRAIEVNLTYRHDLRPVAIPPVKSIHYLMMVIPRSDLPVILNASEVTVTPARRPARVVTVTGRLMKFSGGETLQLVPPVISRENKNSYYIRGKQAATLNKHIGKVITLKGAVSQERNSPYEWDLDVHEVVKVYD